MLRSILPLAAALLAVTAVLRWRDVLPGVPPERRTLTGAIAATAVAACILSPTVGDLLASSFRVPHIDVLLGRAVLVIASFLALRAITLIFQPNRGRDAGRGDLLALGMVLVVMIVAFCAQPLPRGGDLVNDHSDRTGVAVMMAAFSLYFGWCFVNIALRGADGRRSAVGTSRPGWSLLAVGAWFGLVHAVLRLLLQAASLIGDQHHRVVSELARACLATALVCVLFVSLGATWAWFVGLPGRLSAECTRRGQLWKLHPIWFQAVGTVPEVNLESRTASRLEDLLGRDSRWRLYRRVIAVHDAGSALSTLGGNDSRDETGGTAILRRAASTPASDRLDDEVRRLLELADQPESAKRHRP